MQRFAFLIWGCTFFMEFSCTENHKLVGVSHTLDSLISAKEYFLARAYYESNVESLSDFEKHFFGSQINNVFNEPESSEKSIDILFKRYVKQLSEEDIIELLQVKLENNVKLFDYAEAYAVTSQLLEKHTKKLDTTDLIKYLNEIKIWEGLRNTTAQVVIKSNVSSIDLVDGFKLPIKFQDTLTSINMLFDTGANFSVIVQSLVESLGLQQIDASYTVKSIIGEDISATLAVAPLLSFGNIEARNVVFIVFPDEALTFDDFKINGIIGYPVIEALEEVHFQQGGKIYVPAKATKKDFKNLGLDFLTPFVKIESNNRSLNFTFDTGADATWLYSKFYTAFQAEIDGSYQKTSTKIGGIGGAQEFDSYDVNFSFQIANKNIKLDSVTLTTAPVVKTHEYFYGNIGQDVVKSFDEMILNFKYMYVEFK